MSRDVKELSSCWHKSMISSLSVDAITGHANKGFPAGMALRELEKWNLTGEVAATLMKHLNVLVPLSGLARGFLLFHTHMRVCTPLFVESPDFCYG